MVHYTKMLHLIMPLCFKSSLLNKSFLKMSLWSIIKFLVSETYTMKFSWFVKLQHEPFQNISSSNLIKSMNTIQTIIHTNNLQKINTSNNNLVENTNTNHTTIHNNNSNNKNAINIIVIMNKINNFFIN